MDAKVMGALKSYENVALRSAVLEASPHQLVQMLMDGALDRIARAKGCMSRGDVAQKGAHIARAVAILNGLRRDLDMERGGEISANLDALYEYMSRRLLEANARNDTEIVDEVAGLLREIRDAWAQIPLEFRQRGGTAAVVQGAA
jgi:flagellar protein FliS